MQTRGGVVFFFERCLKNTKHRIVVHIRANTIVKVGDGGHGTPQITMFIGEPDWATVEVCGLTGVIFDNL